MKKSTGKIITFYSYKGGVGRSMALANIAVLLAYLGKKVLIIDWDLEAPGLEYFFENYIDINDVKKQNGITDILTSFIKSKTIENTDILKWQDIILPIKIKGTKMPIDLLASGKRLPESHNYNKVFYELNITEFYSKYEGGYFIESLRNEWKKEYDFVLVDSRTGITDMSGICTVQLPDMLILLFVATKQSFYEVVNVAKKSKENRRDLPFERKALFSLPILSRFSTSENPEKAKEWRSIVENGLEEIYDHWLPENINRGDFILKTYIPHDSRTSYGEFLTVIEDGITDPAGAGAAYDRITTLIESGLDSKVIKALMSRQSLPEYNIGKEYSGDKLKIFISSSGKFSGAIALRLKTWLEGFDSMIKAILPSQDFIAGSSWKESFEELLNSDYSLIILTKDNINSPWMMFEAGVLSKSNQKYYQNRICPIIFGRNESDVEAPLSYFNVLNFSQQGRQGLHSLLEDVYERLKSSLRKEVKSSSLYIEETWQELETDIDAIIKANKNAHPSRNRNNVRTLKNLYMNLSKEQLFKWSNNKNMTVRQLPVLLKEYVDYKLEDENYKIPNPVFETTTVVINSTRISIFFVFTDGKAVLLFDRKSPNIQIDNERYDMFGGVEFDSTSFIKKIGKNNEFLDLKIENIDYMSGMAIEDNIDKNMQGETVIMIGYVIYVKEINKNVETEENNVKLLDIEILKNIKNITSKAALAKEFFLEKR